MSSHLKGRAGEEEGQQATENLLGRSCILIELVLFEELFFLSLLPSIDLEVLSWTLTFSIALERTIPVRLKLFTPVPQ